MGNYCRAKTLEKPVKLSADLCQNKQLLKLKKNSDMWVIDNWILNFKSKMVLNLNICPEMSKLSPFEI